MKKLISLFLAVCLCTQAVGAEDYIKWVDFTVGYEALRTALEVDIQSQETERPLRWIDILALAATRKGGSFTARDVKNAARELEGDESPEEFLGEQLPYYRYYQQAYGAALGGLVGNYAVKVETEDGQKEWKAQYGLKAFSPVASGYWYSHYDDFGAGRSYGFARKHLGNDLLGSLGTPIVAVEGGTVEALGWNQYGGWRIGIRSKDKKRYYYYAHLRKDKPYVQGLKEGDQVQAGDVIGFMGRSGYSVKENVNNIELVHLHFGLQLIFDESQKECNSEIWIDVYDIVRLLEQHRSSVRWNPEQERWERIYEFRDLDV